MHSVDGSLCIVRLLMWIVDSLLCIVESTMRLVDLQRRSCKLVGVNRLIEMGGRVKHGWETVRRAIE
jgi:hypothetical protein